MTHVQQSEAFVLFREAVSEDLLALAVLHHEELTRDPRNPQAAAYH